MPGLGRKRTAGAGRRTATEAQILHGARELLSDGEAFGDLSIEQIASRGGISRTVFYDYFRDKRELLIRLIADSVAPVLREADELVGGRPSGPHEIPFTIRAAMDWIRENPGIYRAGIEAAAYDDVVGSYWREKIVDRFIDAIEARIRRQQAEGVALPVDPRAAATVLVLMVMHALSDHITRDRGISDTELFETLTTISVRAVYGPADEEVQTKP